MKDKTFSATFVLTVSKNNNILGSYDEAHEEDVNDLIVDTFYDIDDVEVENLVVKERP